jgi:hypothetical protein
MALTPEQMRMDANVPAMTIYQAAPQAKTTMHNQWKVSSNYITCATPTQDTPNKTPVASGSAFQRFHPAEELAMPYGNKTILGGERCVWPPKINMQHNFNLANYPPISEGGVHLERNPYFQRITAGLGGIDPTM